MAAAAATAAANTASAAAAKAAAPVAAAVGAPAAAGSPRDAQALDLSWMSCQRAAMSQLEGDFAAQKLSRAKVRLK